ncbi:MAG TPA: FAD-linked oxidase C-terminal domain-containing protein [Chitinophagaceae bacterium]|nr:FAD-linked oxidase C-terminal domain-containing protein [Chitinophagaceae bacterium]
MNENGISRELTTLGEALEGTLHTDEAMRILYSTDASAYRELPLAVAIPENQSDLQKLIRFARDQKTSLIPRTAGTSLAGQVVGGGIVVDLSRKFTRILEMNPGEQWVRVEPGVIRDELNMMLRPHGFFFAPETSTANRAMIGGMAGNNSCGSNSVVYGSTRDHLLEVKTLLSDGSEAVFGPLDNEGFQKKCEAPGLEGELYRNIRTLLSDAPNREEIDREFPRKTIRRRNTGYALDLLAGTAPFREGGAPFNFCKLIAGSEGTLALVTGLKLHIDPLPPPETGLLCVHFRSIDESLRANVIAMGFHPSASELIDHYILECTRDNIEQRKNSFFVEGEPAAILVIEFCRESREEIEVIAGKLTQALRQAGLGYHYPLLFGKDTARIWSLRKAGLGLLGNMPGNAKPVPVIEDTAVEVRDLPDYIAEFNVILKRYGLYSVHYAHAGSGEIHLRPILDLKTAEGHRLFRTIAEQIAALVKKYGGSLSGEHGDGRLRGEFIRRMVGEKNYGLLLQVKHAWDPMGILNPGKIVDTPPMDTMLRYMPGQQTGEIRTLFDFGPMGILAHAEQCNGTGDCRKTHLSGGTMCPSYMATRDEKDTTRARANILREFLTRSTRPNRFNHKEIYEVMDLCLSCKGCKSECPSNVDVAKLKMEFLQQYYDSNGTPLRARIIGGFSGMNRAASKFPWLYNTLVTLTPTASLIKSFCGFAAKRPLPLLHHTTLRRWFRWHMVPPPDPKMGKLYLFCDEFTNYNDTLTGIHSVQLLEWLGYEVILIAHEQSGRAMLSKGLLRRAKPVAEKNIRIFSPLVSAEAPLVGIEPSAILTFRDEYPDLVSPSLREAARAVAANSFLAEEFLSREIKAGKISPDRFTEEKRVVWLHGHCQQKALSSMDCAMEILSLPRNYEVKLIPSGCCGMAGSFGYEKEHYDLSFQIGELVLFPAVRKADPGDLVAAAGTSCRHQIQDGTGRTALHPMEILYQAFN